MLFVAREINFDSFYTSGSSKEIENKIYISRNPWVGVRLLHLIVLSECFWFPF